MGACSSRLVAAGCALGIACGGTQHSTLSRAGDDRDEGAGELAQASLRLMTPANNEPAGFDDARRRAPSTTMIDFSGGAMYGGAPYGGAAYGGATYASWQAPQWTYSPPARAPRYAIVGGLRGAIEGTVTWTGAPPARVATACGTIENPTLHVGKDHALRGALVFIEKVAVGRATPYYQRPASVGGVVSKRGCALVPAVQLVAPLPGSIAIHGDEAPATVRVSPEKTAPSMHSLQEAGLVQLEATAGVTRIDSPDGKLSASWVIAIDSPYYAVTDDAGRFRIDELAPGMYDVTIWQPPVTTVAADGTFAYGAPTVVHRSVAVGSVGTATTSIAVSLGR